MRRAYRHVEPDWAREPLCRCERLWFGAAGNVGVRRPNFRGVAVAYRILADLVLVMHAAFVAFAVLGALLALRWRWLAWLHVPAVSWGAFIEFTGWVCPLTPVENWFRNAGDRRGYSGGFIEHYIFPLLYSSTL